MSKTATELPAHWQALLPRCEGRKWLRAQLPTEAQPWVEGSKHGIRQHKSGTEKSRQAVRSLLREHRWSWPQREIIFISDVHADADALLWSLAASGGVKLTGSADGDFKLTDKGRKALFLFGGDFFDKGPSNLRLLRVLRSLLDTGARVRLLAGNHDIRILFGMRSVGHTHDPRNGHFFIRMGAKAVPFLREIRDQYLQGKQALKSIPDADACRQALYPQPVWWEQFEELAAWVMPAHAIAREMHKIERKVQRFEQHCDDAGLTIREAYAAALHWQQLFLQPGSEFAWFYKQLRLAHRKGSFLFVHAGLDDRTAAMLREQGVSFINQLFRQQLQGSPFEFYYGPIANTIRTKYRNVDMPLSRIGARQAHAAGIHCIVHGHRNLHKGQRIAVRKRLLHFECDVTLDAGSRAKEGLSGVGAGATLIHPDGCIMAVSNDYPKIRVFEPNSILEASHGT